MLGWSIYAGSRPSGTNRSRNPASAACPRADQLERDVPAEPRILGQIDDAHPTPCPRARARAGTYRPSSRRARSSAADSGECEGAVPGHRSRLHPTQGRDHRGRLTRGLPPPWRRRPGWPQPNRRSHDDRHPHPHPPPPRDAPQDGAAWSRSTPAHIDGIEVRLLWHPSTATSRSRRPMRDRRTVHVSGRPGPALGAFRHPFAFRAELRRPAY